MKRLFDVTLIFATVMLVSNFSFSKQASKVRVTFTGKDATSGSVVNLDSVRVQNLLTFRDTVLFSPFIIDLDISTGINDKFSAISTTLELSGNFANPFTDDTKFQITCVQSGLLNVDLYSMIGARVASLQIDVTNGKHEFIINGRALPVGVYILIARDGKNVRSLRIMKSGIVSQGSPSISYIGSRFRTTANTFSKSLAAVSYRFIGYALLYKPDSVLATPTTDTQIQFRFVRIPKAPVLTTTNVTNITTSTASSGGIITSDGGFSVTARGVCWSTLSNPTIANSKTNDGTGAGSFTSNITGLNFNTNYYVRSYATNSAGTGYGNEVSFTTKQGQVPVLTTASVSNITQITATCGGTITYDGGLPVTTRGVCWSTSQNPTTNNSKTTDGIGTGSFTSSLTGLITNTIYYIRAYATNIVGTGYGVELSFSTQGLPTVTDIDGNVYHIVTIGSQVWMVENLKTTRLNDGTPIPLVTGQTAWSSLTTPGYCWYDNDAAYKDIYGALYNWHVVNTSKLAPTGWHVPTDAEWTTLKIYLGGESVAGGKMKEAGTAHWNSPNTGANNSSGFTALAGGMRDYGGIYNYTIRGFGGWWSSTEDGVPYAWYLTLGYGSAATTRGSTYKAYGYSVRCVKD